MKYPNGKISCVLGTLAFMLVILANYSNQHSVGDLSNPLIALAINKLLAPLNRLQAVLSDRKLTEVSITKLPLFYIFENEAILLLNIISTLLTCSTLYFCFKAIRELEENIWYANGLNLVILTVFSLYVWIGLAISIFLLYLSDRLKKVGNSV